MKKTQPLVQDKNPYIQNKKHTGYPHDCDVWSYLVSMSIYFRYRSTVNSHDGSVGISTGYVLEGRGSELSMGEIFLFSTTSRPAMGPSQPSIQWLPGALSPRVKRQGCEADHSPHSSAEVKKGGSIQPLPHTPSWLSA
jgi:hypothetical protein